MQQKKSKIMQDLQYCTFNGKESDLCYQQLILKYRIIHTSGKNNVKKNSPVGPLSSKQPVKRVKSLMLIALVRADHAHLSDVIVLVRPLQKRVLES